MFAQGRLHARKVADGPRRGARARGHPKAPAISLRSTPETALRDPGPLRTSAFYRWGRMSWESPGHFPRATRPTAGKAATRLWGGRCEGWGASHCTAVPAGLFDPIESFNCVAHLRERERKQARDHEGKRERGRQWTGIINNLREEAGSICWLPCRTCEDVLVKGPKASKTDRREAEISAGTWKRKGRIKEKQLQKEPQGLLLPSWLKMSQIFHSVNNAVLQNQVKYLLGIGIGLALAQFRRFV